jgi:hypothetical protein
VFLALSLNPIQALRAEQNLSLALAVALIQALRLEKALALSLALALDWALSLALSWMVQEALAAVGSQRVPKPCFPSALEKAMGCSSLLFFSLEFLIPFLMLSIPSTGGCRRHRQGGGALIDKGGVDRIDRVGARIDRVRRLGR